MTTKTHNRVIKFDPNLDGQIVKAAKAAYTDVTKWVRAACREKLARDDAARKQIAAQAAKEQAK